MTPRWRLRLRVAATVAVLLAVALYLTSVDTHEAQALFGRLRASIGPWTLVLLATLYALALALPFVPAMEIGLVIMVAFGPVGVVVIYLATLAGLNAAFVVGQRLASPRHREPAQASATSSGQAGARTPLHAVFETSWLGRRAPPWLLIRLRRHRHLALAVALNLPGNALLGGGGGIAFLCGLSRTFGWSGFMLTVAMATAPVPVLLLTGVLALDPLAGQSTVAYGGWAWLQHVFERER
jgi:hypothetical protein